jgi:hypothetical protein
MPARVVTIACLAALASALAAVASPLASAAPARTAATPRCATSGLVVWLDTSGNGAAGSVYYSLELTNLSARTCTLAGYPGVAAVDLRGRQLGAAAIRDASQRPRTVTLARGATATATLRIVEAANFPAASCRETTAAGLRVYPPGQTAARLVPFPLQACSRSTEDVLSVRAVRAGA